MVTLGDGRSAGLLLKSPEEAEWVPGADLGRRVAGWPDRTEASAPAERTWYMSLYDLASRPVTASNADATMC